MTEATERSERARISSARVVVIVVLATVPVLELGWPLGGGHAARDALSAMGPANWLDIVIGVFLAEPLLATVLAIVASRVTYAYSAARGGAARHAATPLTVTAAEAAIIPIGLGQAERHRRVAARHATISQS